MRECARKCVNFVVFESPDMLAEFGGVSLFDTVR